MQHLKVNKRSQKRLMYSKCLENYTFYIRILMLILRLFIFLGTMLFLVLAVLVYVEGWRFSLCGRFFLCRPCLFNADGSDFYAGRFLFLCRQFLNVDLFSGSFIFMRTVSFLMPVILFLPLSPSFCGENLRTVLFWYAGGWRVIFGNRTYFLCWRFFISCWRF